MNGLCSSVPCVVLAFWLLMVPVVSGAQPLPIREVLAKRGDFQSRLRVRGVVTYADPSTAFIQDQTGAIQLRLGGVGGAHPLAAGQAVECEGNLVSSPLVVLQPRTISVLGEEPFPPAVPADYSQMVQPGLNGHYVEVEARVRSLRHDATANLWFLRLDAGEGIVRAEFRSLPPGTDVGSGSVVRVQGVCRLIAEDAGGWAPRLLAHSIKTIHVADTDPFALPLTALHSALAAPRSQPVKVRGIVTFRSPTRRTFSVQQNDQALFVETANPEAALPGDAVELVAFPAEGGGRRFLEDASLRVTGRTNPPNPLIVGPRELDATPADARLVSVRARYLWQTNTPQGFAIGFAAEGLTFHAYLPAGSAPIRPRRGDLFQITGVCRSEPDATVFARFSLALRSNADLLALRTGSILRAIVGALMPLTLVVALFFLLVWVLRRSPLRRGP